jgi:hypothetical protein
VKTCRTFRHAFMSGVVVALSIGSVAAAERTSPVRWEKIVLTERYYCDGIAAGDVNRDGAMDVVAGPFWYEGPDFRQAHEFYPAVVHPTEEKPTNSMFSFVHDFSGDGWPDILVLGRVKFHCAYWYENPGPDALKAKSAEWKQHYVYERINGETPTLTDIDGDGRPELLTHQQGRWGWVAPNWDKPREPWVFHAVGEDEGWEEYYHGEGVGDVNGDGRLDIVINDGWYEQPPQASRGRQPPDTNTGEQSNPSGDSRPRLAWAFHRGVFSDDRGGAQIYVDDADGDGDGDVITAKNAHEWGLSWFEQVTGEKDAPADALKFGDARFVEHKLMGTREEEAKYGVAFSQPHAIDLADIDGDGLKDIIVGKRMWAHGPTGDVEPMADPVLYWFQLRRNADGTATYVPHLIDDRSGLGVQVTAADVNADGRTDVLTVSKLGAFVFLNRPAK